METMYEFFRSPESSAATLAASFIEFFHAHPFLTSAATFLCGAVAVMAGARLSVMAAILSFALLVMREVGLSEFAPDILFVPAIILFLLGLLQAVLAALFGDQQASAILSMLIMSVLLFLFLRAPRKIAAFFFKLGGITRG